VDTTIYFKNGLQLQIDTDMGEELERRLIKYLRAPNSDQRASSITYNDGGTNNRTLLVDLDSLIAIQRGA
jgi:hypothetical protein